jgi:hypothetical protein
VDHVREHRRLSKELLELARPIVLAEMARKGWQTRKREARQNGHSHNARKATVTPVTVDAAGR